MVNVVYIAQLKHYKMDGRKTKKVHCHYKWKKPFVNDISVQLGLNDRLCIRMRNNEYECNQVSEWLEKNPLAVLVENVINKGPSVRSDVYDLFLQKTSHSKLMEERTKYMTSQKLANKSN